MAPHTFDGYSQLPTNVAPPAFWRVQGYASHYSRVAVQYVRNARRSLVLGLIAAFVFFLVVIAALGGRGARGGLMDGPPLLGGPPDWSDMWAYEAGLPQHNPNLTFPEGASGRYVKFTCEVQQLGWNNALNERLMNAHLAYASKRAYVFQDYIWKHEYYPWQQSQYLDPPPRTPMNALIAGPAAGGEWDPEDPSPRSVSATYYDEVCPPEQRRVITTGEVKDTYRWESGDVIFRAWRDLLLDAPERCIEIVPEDREKDGYPQVFDLFLWGSDRILSLYDEFIKSPVSRLHATSSVVAAGVARNLPLFRSRGKGGPLDPFERTLAMHIRRGDFKDACLGLAAWNSTFYSWNLLPELPDRFTAHEGGGWGWNTEENIALYLEHCLPTFEAIVQKTRDAKRDYLAEGEKKGEKRILDVMYILTNDESAWLDELKDALRKDGWGTIVTTKDLRFDQETMDTNMAVDMELARLAAVFIGNGWSSFTSNIVHRRLVDQKEFISTRFF
ncbi:hypothetical protein FB107DRAFT_263945 [Schizophyllum commune]